MIDPTHNHYCSLILDFPNSRLLRHTNNVDWLLMDLFTDRYLVVLSLWGFCWTTNTSVTNSREASEGREDRWHPCQRRHHKHHENTQTTVPRSHRLLLFYVPHLCCSVPRRATPIKTEIWNLLRPLRRYFGTVLFSIPQTKNTKLITALRFTISYNATRGTSSRNQRQRSFFCYLLGNWKSERRGELVDCEGNQGACVVT